MNRDEAMRRIQQTEVDHPMREFDGLFRSLARSRFRSGFQLSGKDLTYLRNKGLPLVLRHGADFIEQRLAPAQPRNDGRQTPWRGHPVFVAQHATATCCRSCLAKWHGIAAGVELTADERDYVLAVIEAWLRRQIDLKNSSPEEPPA